MTETIFTKIGRQLHLGALLAPPEPLKGGLTHKMYSLYTSSGKYAVKLLNPFIMQRATAFRNYENAEKLEAILEESVLPILPALAFGGKKMQEIDGQYYYIFQWYDGKAINGTEITAYHCAEIGKALAKIHGIHKTNAPYVRDEMSIDWDFYLPKMERENPELYRLLLPQRALLYRCQEQRSKAVQNIPAVLTICHNDMDPKNVLWNGADYRIIDLECLSYANPVLELYETALCWSGYEQYDLNFDLFRTLIQSYIHQGGTVEADWESVYDSNYGSLEWLEYNIKRVLGIDCGADEKDIGTAEVKNTLSRIVYYSKMKKEILEHLQKL